MLRTCLRRPGCSPERRAVQLCHLCPSIRRLQLSTTTPAGGTPLGASPTIWPHCRTVAFYFSDESAVRLSRHRLQKLPASLIQKPPPALLVIGVVCGQSGLVPGSPWCNPLPCCIMASIHIENPSEMCCSASHYHCSAVLLLYSHARQHVDTWTVRSSVMRPVNGGGIATLALVLTFACCSIVAEQPSWGWNDNRPPSAPPRGSNKQPSDIDPWYGNGMLS